MPHTDLVFKSKAQAERLRLEFIDRYGEEDGVKKYAEIEKRSPKMDDLPEKIATGFKHPKKFSNITRKYGRQWRGI